MSGAEPFLLAASVGLGAVSAISQANAANAAADHEADVAKANKIIADQDRQLAMRNADIAAEDASRENRRRLAAMRADYGGSGLEFAGSPLDALADSSVEMALDQRRIAYGGRVANRQGQIEMNNYDGQASAAKMRKTNPYLSAGAALLSGGAKTYKSFDENGYFD